MSDRVLPGSERYRVSQDAGAAYGTTLVDRANAVSIHDVLRDFLDINVPVFHERSWKDYCPFGFEHPDGGVDKGWRIYSMTNSSYCFVQHGSMGPVRLVALRKELSHKKAAYAILDRYDLIKPRHYRQRYDELIQAQATRMESIGNLADLVGALHQALSQEPFYAERQFTTEFAEQMEAALGELNDLTSSSPEAVREWFTRAKSELGATLR